MVKEFENNLLNNILMITWNISNFVFKNEISVLNLQPKELFN